MVDLDAIPGSWHLPRPNWRIIGEWIDSQVPPEARDAAWHSAASQWLDRLARALGGEYEVRELDDFLLLSACDPVEATWLLQSAAAAKARVVELVGSLGEEAGSGPHVMLAFDTEDAYAQYVLDPNDQATVTATGGSCFTEGYVHIALPPHESTEQLLLTLAHEITHMVLALRRLELPLWLEEGITHMVEVVCGARSAPASEEDDILSHFQKVGLHDFWYGSSFDDPDAQRASYTLSAELMRRFVTEPPDAFRAFCQAARRGDAGEHAAERHLGKTLADLVTPILGPGEWHPQPSSVTEWILRGQERLACGEAQGALDDFLRARDLDPAHLAIHEHVGDAELALGQYAAACESYSRALEREPDSVHAHCALSWILSTAPDAGLRDGPRALELATWAAERTAYGDRAALASLGAALAECGERDEAREWLLRARELAEPSRREEP